ncbi:hypothetical protein BDM02DRAFT_3132536 [Thelephora ganbajun]|uniref:Uncharacterized protein n=1 Tax=Thelephora ganbajun TaxID=370292 RepID=A0ACB6Z0R3_THEGA|nr:hypothetical protein BDM02DRAFT_3132536 [Thelephora ganbajun]
MLDICHLDFQFSPEVEWTLVSHHRVLVVLLASPFHKRRFLKVASRKGRLGYTHVFFNHRLLDHPLIFLPFWTMEGLDEVALLAKNVALECEVEGLDGEFGVLLACIEALEWVAPSEYLSVEDLLRMGGEGEVASMETNEAVALGLRPDFQDLVDRLDPIDTTAPLFPHSF